MTYQNSGSHILHQFDQDLETTRTKVLRMGGLVEKQLENCLSALNHADSSLAEQVANSDSEVNALELSIDKDCTDILALRQPTASDLRLVVSMIKTITDLERIGDEAEKIGRYGIDIASDLRNTEYFAILKQLGVMVQSMLHDSLDTFARMDTATAASIVQSDKKVNEQYDVLTKLLMNQMMQHPDSVKMALGAMLCGRALERIGDHAKNVCEYVIYTVKGTDIRHKEADEFES